MTDELIEQLAKRFCEVLERDCPEVYRQFPCGFDARSTQAVARECLRQMEWARRSYWEPKITAIDPDVFPQPSGFTVVLKVLGPQPLTLAPPEWKP